jgi:restriction endonuclease Mrr
MLPLLRFVADGKEHSLREAIEKLADHFDLSDEERKALLPSGRQATFDNRVGSARTYMKKAGLLQSPARVLQDQRGGHSSADDKPGSDQPARKHSGRPRRG